MICPKCGNDMGTSMYCDKCNTYPFKEKEPYQWKKFFKIFGIMLGAFAIFVGLLFGFINIIEMQAEKKEIKSDYDRIYQEYSDKEYSNALSYIKSFQKEYGNKDKKTYEKVQKLYNDIEQNIYNQAISEKDNKEAEDLCISYMDYFPEGKHIKEINKKYAEISEILAPIRISEAKQKISEGEILDANNLLSTIIQNKNISKKYVKEAQTIKDNIAERVKYETPVSVKIEDLLSDAIEYNMRKVNLYANLVIRSVDRERKMLLVYPVSKDTALGYDHSFPLEIYYGKTSNPSKWGSISSNDYTKISSVSGRFKIYSNRNNSGYIEADSIY